MAAKSDLLKTEASAGLILLVAALAGLIAANSPLAGWYFGALHTEIPIRVGSFAETHHVLDWIKEGLLAVFFFVVGLEIKFEAVKGELSSPKRLAFPLICAVGGMVAPALVYLAFNAGSGGHPQGWPIPVATDIVFALAALAAVGARAPPGLRVFLLALAVIDDLGAVVLIAVLFTADVDPAMVGGAGATLAIMALMSRWKRAHTLLYLIGAVVVWAFTLKSGIATSVGAVAAALTIPVAQRRPGEAGMAHRLTDALRPYVSFGILPIFAFAATGFSLWELSLGDIISPVSIGVFAGLLFGKPLGIFAASRLAVALRLAHKPAGVSWRQLFAAASLCGVGFTMSLYLAGLAFDEGGDQSAAARIGIMLGSLAATVCGVALLRSGGPRAEADRP